MMYVTGDCHADFSRFSTDNFPEQKNLTKDDYIIICGDFGGVWNYLGETNEEKYWLDWLDKKPFTTLFVDGNHENFKRLKEYPRVKYHGGFVHRIRGSVFHLMRGYVYEFSGKKFFTFGGAKCHDIQDGILDPQNFASLSDCWKVYKLMTLDGKMVRIKGVSWWADELPSKAEMDRGIKNLEKSNWKVDYVISHCAPLLISSRMYNDDSDKLTRYFDKLIDSGLLFRDWWFGHYHGRMDFDNKHHMIYGDIVRLL